MNSPAKPPRQVSCPTCGKAVAWVAENTHRPFCSERCRQIDLGAWASDAYVVPGDAPLDEDGNPSRAH